VFTVVLEVSIRDLSAAQEMAGLHLQLLDLSIQCVYLIQQRLETKREHMNITCITMTVTRPRYCTSVTALGLPLALKESINLKICDETSDNKQNNSRFSVT
jgi:hypothetical protein